RANANTMALSLKLARLGCPKFIAVCSAVYDFDLSWQDGFDPGTPSLFDHAPNPYPASRQRLWHESAAGKQTLVSLRYRNGEILVPPAPEVDVDGCPAFTHRDDFALDDGETASR